MIKHFLLFAGLLLSVQVIAQTGIGTSTPNASAKLDVSSSTLGFLPPRVTLTAANTFSPIVGTSSAATGLLVYNLGSVGLQAGYYYWNGANWATIATGTTAGNAVIAGDLVKLYQETYSTTAGKASSSTGYSFTVPVSGRYEFNFNCTGWNSNGSLVKLTFNIREGTNVIGTDYHQSASSAAWVEYEGRFEVNLTAGVTYNAQVVTTTGRRDTGYDWDKIMYKMVAGNLPVNQHMAERNLQLNNNFISNDGGDEGIRIDNAGNVGIGVTSPTDMLVVGSTLAVHDGGNKVLGLGLSPGSAKSLIAGYPAEIRLDPASGKLFLGTDPTLRTIGSNAGVQKRMTITSSGNVGIGSEDPSSKLFIASSGTVAINVQSTASDNNGMIILNANTSGGWGNNWHEFMMFQNQGTYIGGIINNGSSSITFATSSDYRLKTDLRNFKGLDLINKIKTYDYAWKSDSTRMYGFMAHELQSVLPYVVTGQKDAVDENGKMIPQSVDYSKLTPVLVKAVQEQDVKIKELQLQIEALLKRLEIVELKK
jgi:hypothetical protein